MNFLNDEDYSPHNDEDYDDYNYGFSEIDLSGEDDEDNIDLIVCNTMDHIIDQIQLNAYKAQFPIPVRKNQYIYEPPDDAPQQEIFICIPRDPPKRRHSLAIATDLEPHIIHSHAVDDFVIKPIISRYLHSWQWRREEFIWEHNVHFKTVQEIQAKLKQERDLEVDLEVEKQRKSE